jgi:hypothetical protein
MKIVIRFRVIFARENTLDFLKNKFHTSGHFLNKLSKKILHLALKNLLNNFFLFNVNIDDFKMIQMFLNRQFYSNIYF